VSCGGPESRGSAGCRDHFYQADLPLEDSNDYCVVFNRLESTFGDDIGGILELLRPLVNELGQPARKSEVTLFAGQYKKTPFGIHHDDEVNFFWPLIGPKRIRLWKPEYGSANPSLAWNGIPSQKRSTSGQLKEKLSKLLLRAAAAESGSTLFPNRQQEDSSEAIPSMIENAARLFSGICPVDINDLLTEAWVRKATTAALGVAQQTRGNDL
jgi:hypothetical protein